MQDYITQSIQEGIRLKENILNNRQMLADIETVGNLIVQALRQGHKVLLCGNGGSAADAQHIAAELVGRFVTEREGLPAIAMTTDTSILTAVSNDYGFDRVFERQTAAWERKVDILIGLSYQRQLSQRRACLAEGTIYGHHHHRAPGKGWRKVQGTLQLPVDYTARRICQDSRSAHYHRTYLVRHR